MRGQRVDASYRAMITSSKKQTRHADTGRSSPDNINTVWFKCRIYFIPYQPRTNVDGVRVGMIGDFLESRHGDLYSRGRCKAGVQVMASVLDLVVVL